MVQQCVDVMENVAIGNRLAIGRAKLRQRPVGDVFRAVAPVLRVGAEGELNLKGLEVIGFPKLP